MVWFQTLRLPVYSQVPLSCVPPCSSPVGFCGLAARCWNCSVFSPLFRLKSCVGMAERSRRQVLMLLPVGKSPRWSHWDDASTYAPLERTRPPSDPSNQTFGFPGRNTSACWSGWMPLGVVGDVASNVISVKVRLLCAGSGSPAVVERIKARPFDRKPYSVYWYEPITKTVSGWPAGVRMSLSYQHCPVQ